MLAEQAGGASLQSSAGEAADRLQVLSIAHSAVTRSGGRMRYERLAKTYPNIEANLVIPACWSEYGRWIEIEPPNERDVRIHLSKIRLPRAGLATWHMHYYPGLRKLVQMIRPNVIHLWEEPWSFVTLQAVLLRRLYKPSAAVVLEVDQNIHKRLPPPFQQIRRYVLRHVDYILARSVSAIEVVRANGYNGPASLIDYGVDSTIFRPLDRSACRAEFGFEGFTVGFVGRLIVEKGLDDLFEGVRQCQQPLSLAVMGEGPDSHELVRRGHQILLPGRLKFFPWGSSQRVARFLNAVDVLVVVTRTTTNIKEQFGRIIIEAHSCGVPVIGSECGAIPDIVGEGGWIVPERDPASIARTLDAVASSPELRENAILAGGRQIEHRFNFDEVARTLADSWSLAYELRCGTLRTDTGTTVLTP